MRNYASQDVPNMCCYNPQNEAYRLKKTKYLIFRVGREVF